MPKTNLDTKIPPPADEPSIGFAKTVGPPIWWYSALAVVVILFLVIILLSIIRWWLKPSTSNNSQVDTKLITQITNNPLYRQDSFLTPLPYQNFTVTISKNGSVTSDTIRPLKLNDVLLVFNQDSVEHSISIQTKKYILSPNEMYAYKVSSTSIISLSIEIANAQNKVYSFVVQ